MIGYVIRRVLSTIPVLLVVSLVVFALIRLSPGDPAALIAGHEALEGEVEAIREQLGLNRPLPVQLGIWFRDILQGDLGRSIVSKHPVLDLIRQWAVPTISLAILTEIIAISLAVPIGVLAAWKANTWIDRSVMVFATLGFSIPVFWLGFLMIYLFAVQLDLFPAAGYVAPSEGFLPFLHRMVMPAVATGVILMALIARMTRATVLEILGEDYVRTARAKGLAEKSVLIRHALRNAALPIMTVIGLGVAGVLSGVVVTESVFAIPGLGRLLVNSILARDYPIIQGVILVVSGVYVFVNLLVDISYAYFDPRVRY
jgi:peptide/nickel transport system permease protein